MNPDGSTTDQYYIRDRQVVSGPFDIDTLRRFAKMQRLARHHQISTDRLTWARAGETLPDVFVLIPPKGAHRRGMTTTDEMPGTAIDIEPVAPPEEEPWSFPPTDPGGTYGSGRRSLGPILIGIAAFLVAGGVIGGLLWSLTGLAGSRWSDARYVDRVSPSMVVIRGTRPDGTKASCFGVIVGRNHVVAPLMTAEFRAPKAEVQSDDGEQEWHSIALTIIDPTAKLAVFRGDLGKDVTAIAIDDDQKLPRSDDDLRLVAPDRRDLDVVCHGEVDTVVDRGKPEQALIVSCEDDQPVDEILGRAIMGLDGSFAAIAVGLAPNGSIVCTPANEVRIKRSEAKKLPNDHTMDPIDLADLASGQGGSPRVAKRDEAPSRKSAAPRNDPDDAEGDDAPSSKKSSNRREDDSTDDQDDQDKGRTTSKRRRANESSEDETNDKTEPRANGKGDDDDDRADESPLVTLGDVGAKVLDGVTDAVAPPLSEERADELGRNMLESRLREHPRCRDQAMTTRLNALCREMLKACDENPRQYTITLITDDEINASAFVGRNILVTDGFMRFVGSDDDMIRYVIAHEIGHIVLKHCDAPFRRLEAADGLAGGRLAAGFAEGVFKNSPMNQDEEREADSFAVDCLRKAGRSCSGAKRFFDKIVKELGEDPDLSDEPVGALFSSHPDHRSRVEAITRECGGK